MSQANLCRCLIALSLLVPIPALAQPAFTTQAVNVRAYAKSGGAATISGYLGKSDTFDRALSAFAPARAIVIRRSSGLAQRGTCALALRLRGVRRSPDSSDVQRASSSSSSRVTAASAAKTNSRNRAAAALMGRSLRLTTP
jgi:hypothetical protein